MKSKSISADADKIVNGLLVCKPLADEVYNKLRLLALQDEEAFRNKRFQERVIATLPILSLNFFNSSIFFIFHSG